MDDEMGINIYAALVTYYGWWNAFFILHYSSLEMKNIIEACHFYYLCLKTDYIWQQKT